MSFVLQDLVAYSRIELSSDDNLVCINNFGL